MKFRACVGALAATALLLIASSSATKAQMSPGDSENPSWRKELSAKPTPRTPDGKPDLSGLWQRASNRIRERMGQDLLSEGYSDAKGNVKTSWGGHRGNDGAGGFINFQRDSGLGLRAEPNMPLYKPEHWERVQWLDDNGNFEDPEIGCLPYGVPRMGPPNRIIQMRDEFVFLYRTLNTFRTIPMNEPLPPVGEWMGLYWKGKSSARWEGDTLVIESVDFSENSWLGYPGYFHSADMRVTERITRQGDVLTWQATVTDPVLLEPWVMNPWYLRAGAGKVAGQPEETEPCKDLSREHMTLKERG